MIIAPGGGMMFLSWESEGTQVAQWLNAHGIAAFVLKYRLRETAADPAEFQDRMTAMLRTPAVNKEGVDVHTLAVADAKQAIRLVRQHAKEWGIATDRVGLMGFSSGASITTGVLTSYDAESRPNLAAAIYGGQAEEAKIPADAPPLFILCAADDPMVPPVGSADLFTVWKKTKHQAELHIYAAGGHGFGMHKQRLPIDHWIERMQEWMAQQGLLKAAPQAATHAPQATGIR